MVKQGVKRIPSFPTSLQTKWMAEVDAKKRAHLLGQAVRAISFKSKSLGISVLANMPNQREFGLWV